MHVIFFLCNCTVGPELKKSCHRKIVNNKNWVYSGINIMAIWEGYWDQVSSQGYVISTFPILLTFVLVTRKYLSKYTFICQQQTGQKNACRVTEFHIYQLIHFSIQ